MGGGGCGNVWLAESGGSTYAVKVFRPEADSDPVKERNVLVALQGRANVIAFEWSFTTKASPSRVLVLEFVPHGPLNSSGIGELELELRERVCRFVYVQISGALRYMHDTIHMLHADVHGWNILVGQGGVPKLADFGAACFDDRLYIDFQDLCEVVVNVHGESSMPYWMHRFAHRIMLLAEVDDDDIWLKGPVHPIPVPERRPKREKRDQGKLPDLRACDEEDDDFAL